jgi:acetyltransferase-like isoleucine patch superfamily enzyme
MIDKELAPIVLFVFNRPDHTYKTLVSLKANILSQKSNLYIYCDGPKKSSNAKELANIDKVRKLLRNEDWCGKVSIIEREENWGLKENIIDGVTEIVNKYGKIIVLEDDIETSVNFLTYMNESLLLYEKEKEVMHISGFLPFVSRKFPETFFLKYMSCWGWATWKSSWVNYNRNTTYLHDTLKERRGVREFNIGGSYNNLFEQLEKNIDGRLNTWAINWYASIFLLEGLCLYPKISMVRNTGLDGSGTNSKNKKHKFIKEDDFFRNKCIVKPINLVEDKKSHYYFQKYFNKKFRYRKIYSNLLMTYNLIKIIIKISLNGAKFKKMLKVNRFNLKKSSWLNFRIYRNVKLTLNSNFNIKVKGVFNFGIDKGSFPRNKNSAIRIGDNASLIVNGKFDFLSGCNLNISDNAILILGSGYVNHDSKIYCKKRIEIGYNTIIAEEVKIMDSDSHQLEEASIVTEPIKIGNNVWIGLGAIILKGVKIDDGSVIAAHSVVTKSIPKNCLAAGNPAKIIKHNINWKF